MTGVAAGLPMLDLDVGYLAPGSRLVWPDVFLKWETRER